MYLLLFYFIIFFSIRIYTINKLLLILYKYAFITTLPPKPFYNNNIFNIVLARLLKIVGNEGTILIFIYRDRKYYNFTCCKCAFLYIKEYYNGIYYIVELIDMALLSFIK